MAIRWFVAVTAVKKRFLAVPIINGCSHVIDEIPILIDVSCQKNCVPTWMGIRYGWISTFDVRVNLVCNCQGPLRCLQVQL